GVCADLKLGRALGCRPILLRLAGAHIDLCPKLHTVSYLDVDAEVSDRTVPFVFPIALHMRWDEEGCRDRLDRDFGHGCILPSVHSIRRVIEMYRTLLMRLSRNNAGRDG